VHASRLYCATRRGWGPHGQPPPWLCLAVLSNVSVRRPIRATQLRLGRGAVALVVATGRRLQRPSVSVYQTGRPSHREFRPRIVLTAFLDHLRPPSRPPCPVSRGLRWSSLVGRFGPGFPVVSVRVRVRVGHSPVGRVCECFKDAHSALFPETMRRRPTAAAAGALDPSKLRT